MKTLWGHDFTEAYRKSLKVKFKFSRHATRTDRRITDVKETELNRQAGFIFEWLVKGGYVKAGKYKVKFTCAICGEDVNAKKWGGTTLNVKGAVGNLVCGKCAALVERIRKTGKASPSKRLRLLAKKGLVSIEKTKTPVARPNTHKLNRYR